MPERADSSRHPLRPRVIRDRRAVLREKGGQGLVEYALLIAAIAVVLIVGMLFLAGKVDDLFSDSGNAPGTLLPPTVACDSHYPGACIPPPPPVLGCADLKARGIPLPVAVRKGDPHGLDPDGDGLGC